MLMEKWFSSAHFLNFSPQIDNSARQILGKKMSGGHAALPELTVGNRLTAGHN